MCLTSPDELGNPAFITYPDPAAQAAGTGATLCPAHTREFRAAHPGAPRSVARTGLDCARCGN